MAFVAGSELVFVGGLGVSCLRLSDSRLAAGGREVDSVNLSVLVEVKFLKTISGTYFS